MILKYSRMYKIFQKYSYLLSPQKVDIELQFKAQILQVLQLHGQDLRHPRELSQIRTQFQSKLEIRVGSTKVMNLVIQDPETGKPLSMTDTDVFNTGRAIITKPDKTEIADVPIVYVDRLNGEIEFTIDNTITISTNAGNWLGKVQFINSSSQIIDQNIFNFNILF